MEAADASDESIARLEEEVAEAERHLKAVEVSIRAAEVELEAARDAKQFVDPSSTRGAYRDTESRAIASAGFGSGVAAGIAGTILYRLILFIAGY